MICQYSIKGNPVYKFIMPLIKSNMYVILSDDNQTFSRESASGYDSFSGTWTGEHNA